MVENKSVVRNDRKSQDIYSRFLDERAIFLKEEFNSDELNSEIGTRLAANLIWLDAQSQEEVTFYINSKGGDIAALMTIYDTMLQMKSPIKTICVGEAFSSAAVILSAGTPGRRFIYPNSRVMIHQMQLSDISGTNAEVLQEVKRIKKENDALMKIIAKHTKQSLRKIKRDCLGDKYFTATEAIKYGIVDHIVEPRR